MMGDRNAKVGLGRTGNIVSPHGLRQRNERGDRFVDWCFENEQVIANTWFRHHPRYLWTWESPGDRARNQIDYITINERFRNSIQQVKTYSEADCNSDHVPVVATVQVKPKKIRINERKPRRHLQLLKTEGIKNQYALKVRKKI